MDPVVVFDVYLDKLATAATNWTVDTIEAALFERNAWTVDKGDQFLVDATGAGAVEIAAAGYSRQTLASVAVNLDAVGHRALLAGATLDFGTIDAGTDFDTLVIFTQVSDDTDSWMLAAIDLGARTTSGVDVTAVPDADGFFALLQPAP